MNIEYLFYFADIAATKSITKSATNCNMTQQGLSRIVKLLEAHYNVKLIVNCGNRIDLTLAGYDLVKYIEEIKDQYYAAEAMISNYRDAPEIKPVVTIFMTSLASHALAPISGMLSDTFANIRFVEKKHNTIFEKLEKDNNSFNCLYFISVPRKSNISKLIIDKGFVFDPCLTTETAVLCNKNSPYASKKIITETDIASLPIAYANNKTMWEEALERFSGKKPLNFPYACTNNHSFITSSVLAGKAIAFCTTIFSGIGQNDLIVIPLKKPFIIDYGILYCASCPLSPTIKVIAHYMKDMFKNVKYLDW